MYVFFLKILKNEILIFIKTFMCMILQFVKLKSNLAEDVLLAKAKEREPEFKKIPGLMQKYYVQLKEEGSYGGVYIWDSPDSLQAFKDSDLAKSIPQAYEVLAPPSIDIMNIMFQLRD